MKIKVLSMLGHFQNVELLARIEKPLVLVLVSATYIRRELGNPICVKFRVIIRNVWISYLECYIKRLNPGPCPDQGLV